MTNINNMSKITLSNFDTVALIPAYNEENNIETVVKKTLEQNILPLVIDDGSTDKTAELALKLGAKVLKNDTNKGKGYAIRRGLEYIRENFDYKCVVLIDADMQYDPEEAKELVNPILNGKAKVVKGTRNFGKIPFRHMLGNKVWKWVYNNFNHSEVNIKDPCCGFVALSKEVVESINLNKIYGGYIVDSSLLIEITKNGYHKNGYIQQVPVNVEYKITSPIGRGIRMVCGVSWFIFINGLKRKLKIEN